MAILAQPSMFSWQEVEATDEIFRLHRVLEALPDGALIAALEQDRKGKRNDYPVAAMWNAAIAGIVFGHPSGASLLRELARNGELWEVCGFDPLRRAKGISKFSWSRFLARLRRHQDLIDAMFEAVLGTLTQLLPGLGQNLAIDGKAIATCGRKDPEASDGYKSYEEPDAKGQLRKIVQHWFGYKLHLVVDADYELPVAYELHGAAIGESPRLMPLIKHLQQNQPELFARIQTAAADRGYDDGGDKEALYDDHGIVPLIPSRELTQAMIPLDEQRHDTVYLGPTGQVCCKVRPFEPHTEKAFAGMQFMGFEAERQSLKFRCPAAAYGLECQNREACACLPRVRDGAFGRVVRVPLARERRLLGPVYQHSLRFERLYAKRTAVERVNSRIDQVYGLEHHFIRGLKRMKLRVSLSLLVMLGTAVGWVRLKKPQNVRSLLKAA